MFELPIDRPAIMGILNVTPDSFSDGGCYPTHQAAVTAGLKMRDEGADIIDIGGESTRPGATQVDVDEEEERVLPVIERLVAAGVVVSIDTRKPAVAKQALDRGASVVNDVSGLRNPKMVEVVSRSRCKVCIMHMLGIPETMQIAPAYDDVVSEVVDHLRHQAESAIHAGIEKSRIWLDPGIGFGKTNEHNLKLLRHCDRFAQLGYPVLIGVSRKGFIGKILCRDGVPASVNDRMIGSVACQVLAQALGARILRVHDVKAAREAAEVAGAILRA